MEAKKILWVFSLTCRMVFSVYCNLFIFYSQFTCFHSQVFTYNPYDDTYQTVPINSHNAVYIMPSTGSGGNYTNTSILQKAQERDILQLLKKKSPKCTSWKCTYPQDIQYVDEFVSSSKQTCGNWALYHLLTNGSFAVDGSNDSPLQTSDKNITIIHK